MLYPVELRARRDRDSRTEFAETRLPSAPSKINARDVSQATIHGTTVQSASMPSPRRSHAMPLASSWRSRLDQPGAPISLESISISKTRRFQSIIPAQAGLRRQDAEANNGETVGLKGARQE